MNPTPPVPPATPAEGEAWREAWHADPDRPRTFSTPALEAAFAEVYCMGFSARNPEVARLRSGIADLITIFDRYSVERSSEGARAAYADCVKSLQILNRDTDA